MFANKKLSIALKDKGLESEMWWERFEGKSWQITDTIRKQEVIEYYGIEYIPAPSFFEILLKAEKVFGDDRGNDRDGCPSGVLKYQYHSQQLLSMLQEGADEEKINDYVLTHLK